MNFIIPLFCFYIFTLLMTCQMSYIVCPILSEPIESGNDFSIFSSIWKRLVLHYQTHFSRFCNLHFGEFINDRIGFIVGQIIKRICRFVLLLKIGMFGHINKKSFLFHENLWKLCNLWILCNKKVRDIWLFLVKLLDIYEIWCFPSPICSHYIK